MYPLPRIATQAIYSVIVFRYFSFIYGSLLFFHLWLGVNSVWAYQL